MDKVASIFLRKQRSVGSAALVLVIMVLASRLLGLLRDRMLAARFTPEELGVYFAAFRIPNFLFELLVMGALTSAFIPVFTKYLAQDHEDEAHRMASILITITIAALVLVAAPLFIWALPISRFLAPGFTEREIAQMVSFTRFIVLLQVMPLVIGNFFTGILQSYNLFIVPALAPVVYNLGIILGIWVLTGPLGLLAPVVGVGIGAFLFLALHIPILSRMKFRYRPQLDFRHRGVREVGRLLGPRTLGLAVGQIDTTVDLILASLLGARMVTIFNFAQHLQQLPVGLFGATIAQAALPTLSVSSVKEDMDAFKRTVISSLHQVLFFVLPLSVLFIVLRIPMVRLVFGASRFDWEATVLTGMTLSAFSISLFAQAISHVLARGFYALYDTKTPVIVAVVSILLNVGLSIVFIQVLHYPVWALGLSTSIASTLHALFLLGLLNQKVRGFSRNDLLVPPLKMVVASVVTGIALYVPLKLLDQLVFDTTRTFGLLLLTGVTGTIGLSTYLILSWVMGIGEVKSFLRLLHRVRTAGRVFLEPAHEIVNESGEMKI